MDTRKERRRRPNTVEWGKNLLIVLLVFSAVYLAGRSGMVHELSGGTPSGWMGSLISFFRSRGEAVPVEAPGDGRPAMAAQAVRIAICNGEERFAVQYDTAQTDRLFDAVGGLLGEGLASAKSPEQVDEAVWRRALQTPGVYFDFLGQIPLDALYAWLGEGASNPNLSGTARRVLLARDSTDAVVLYYSNEETGLYYACGTAVIYSGHMEEMLAGYGGNGAFFAFEYGAEQSYAELDPYVLIFSAPPTPGAARISNPLAGVAGAQLEALQNALSFRPQSSSAVYPVQGGITVREGRETLTIASDGTVTYHAPEQDASRYMVAEDGQSATDAQVIEAARELAAAAGSWAGSARLYLTELEYGEDGTQTVRFGYSLEGAMVRLSGDLPAAEFTVRGGQITDYTIRFRTYEATGETTLVLREQLAAAALSALDREGRELILCYEEIGDLAQAGWVAQ